jgi:hypothetical protein
MSKLYVIGRDLRDKAEQALRLARDTTDQVLVKSLIEVAAALGEDPENN